MYAFHTRNHLLSTYKNMHTNHLVTHSNHHNCKQVLQIPCWDRNQLNLLALIGYLCYLHLRLSSASVSGSNKDILLMVRFNYNIKSSQEVRSYICQPHDWKTHLMISCAELIISIINLTTSLLTTVA